jgi:hypothetical protein
MLLMSRQEGAADPLKTRTNVFRVYATPLNDTCPSVPRITGGLTKRLRHFNCLPYLRPASWFAYSQIRLTVNLEFFMQSPTEIPPR